jgi:UDP-glucuronate 4-epimerase
VRVLVTGAAGFIGSTLCDVLVDEGHSVVGVDCFTDYYDVARKQSNVSALRDHPRFELVEIDLRTAPLDVLDDSVDVVFHQAAQPGIRGSWGANFSLYLENNVLVTQRLLERAAEVGTARFVYASSSSVYGRSDQYPTPEAALPAPHSPYGVTKLAGEHLCSLYAANHGVSTVALRYFTVYGPRQRPDMAISRLIEAASGGAPFPLFGDGEQVRDFTYVNDIVRANLLAGSADIPTGCLLNVAGGSQTTMNELVRLVEEVVGRPTVIERRPAQPGDVPRTGGDTHAIAQLLGWFPEIALSEGVKRQASENHSGQRLPS